MTSSETTGNTHHDTQPEGVSPMDAVRARMQELAAASRAHGERIVGESALRTAASDAAAQARLVELNAQAAALNEQARQLPPVKDIFFPDQR